MSIRFRRKAIQQTTVPHFDLLNTERLQEIQVIFII